MNRTVCSSYVFNLVNYFDFLSIILIIIGEIFYGLLNPSVMYYRFDSNQVETHFERNQLMTTNCMFVIILLFNGI